MSLKAFHVVFVLVSTALAIGFGFWAVGDYLESRSALHLSLGIVSFVSSLGLVWYGNWFLKKYKKLSYL